MGNFLFPVPRKAIFADKKHDLSALRWITLPAESSVVLKNAVIAFAENIRENFPLPVTVAAGIPAAGGVLLNISLDSALDGVQHYRITSGKAGICLTGSDEAGLYYGLGTLEQLISQNGIFFPECEIDDSPDFEQRGFMLDVSRCKVPTMPELFAFIDLLATLKYNQLQLYIEHTFAFSAHETVWHDSSPFTSEEILQIDLYCRERFIELVPNLNSFGHLERWLKYPEYKHLGECPDGFSLPGGMKRDCSGVLKPNDDSLAFLDELYREYLPNFSSRKFNIGCDETWELGEGWSRSLCENKGKTRIYLDFLLKITELAERHEREVMFWGDIILHQPELISELPKNITALNWGYEADHDFETETAAFAKSGVPFYICPGTSSWNSLTGRTDNCMNNLLNATLYGSKNNAAGLLMTDWGDNGHHQYAPISWPGICAGGAYAWCREVNRHADIAEAVDLLIAQDCAGVVGDYLLSYGNLYTIFSDKVRNATFFGKALITKLDEKPDWVEQYTVKEVYKVLHKLFELRGHLGTALPQTENGRLIIDELLNSSLMTECALNKMLLLKGEEVNMSELRKLFRHVIGKHEQLWLARNRPGGLNESSGHLRTALAELS